MDNLWPKIETSSLKTPVTILKEQASLLGANTQNLITAEVSALKIYDTKITGETTPISEVLNQMNSVVFGAKSFHPSAIFRFAFHLVAPALNHYRYQLFFIGYGIDFYPVFFRLDSDIQKELMDDDEQDVIAGTEEEFLETLKAIFNSEKTLRVMRAILAQSQNITESV